MTCFTDEVIKVDNHKTINLTKMSLNVCGTFNYGSNTTNNQDINSLR